MNIDSAIKELDAHFGPDFSKSNPELVIEYCKAKAIDSLGYKLIEAMSEYAKFHNTAYKLDEKFEHIGDQIGRLAEAIECC